MKQNKNNKKVYLKTALLLLAIVFGSVFVFHQTAHAASAQDDMTKVINSVAGFLTLVLVTFQKIIWPVLVMIGGLLNGDLIFNSPMENMMLMIWTQMRNFVNIMLVLVLVGVALYNVVAGEQQDYHLKAFLPKFVIALIAINFSFVGIKIVLDISNVLSQAIFSLPDTISAASGQSFLSDGAKSLGSKPSDICPAMYGNTNDTDYNNAVAQAGSSARCKPIPNPQTSTSSAKTPATSTTSASGVPDCSKPAAAQATTPDPKYQFNDLGSSEFTKFNANNAAMVMAVNFMQVTKQAYVNPCTVENDLKNLAINAIFSVILTIVYATVFVVLLVVLLTRMAVVWVVACLSPLQFFFKFLPEPIKKMVSVGNIEEEFIAYAFMPIPIGIYMTIGYMMISVFQQISGTDPSFMGSISAMGLNISGIGTVQQLMGAIISVVVVWKGVFAAASAGEFSKTFVEGIKSTVEGAGKFATESLKYAPILPVTKGQGSAGSGRLSLAALGGLGGELEKKLKLVNNFEGQNETLRELVGTNQAAKYYKGIRESTNEQSFKQNLADMNLNTTATDKYSQQMQKAIGDGIKNSKVQLKIPEKGIVDTTGKAHTKEELSANNYKALLDLLSAGKVNNEGLDNIIKENTIGVSGRSEAAQTSKEDKNPASADPMGEFAKNPDKKKFLSASEQDKIKKYEDAKGKNNPHEAQLKNDAEKAYQAAQARENAAANLSIADDKDTMKDALAKLEQTTHDLPPAEKKKFREDAIKKVLANDKAKQTLGEVMSDTNLKTLTDSLPELKTFFPAAQTATAASSSGQPPAKPTGAQPSATQAPANPQNPPPANPPAIP